MAAEEGKPVWIEQTPQTAAAAAALLRMFPEMRLIHMVRDGRDVASSVHGTAVGPRHDAGGLRWWEKRLRAADAGAAAVPSGAGAGMSLEDLIVKNRELSYARLLDFLGIEDEKKIRKHFDKQLVAENANIGRWRRGMSAWRQARVDKRVCALARAHARRTACAVPPRSAGAGRGLSALQHDGAAHRPQHPDLFDGSAVGVVVGLASLAVVTRFLPPSEYGALRLVRGAGRTLGMIIGLVTFKGSIRRSSAVTTTRTRTTRTTTERGIEAGQARRTLGTALILTALLGSRRHGIVALVPQIAQVLLGRGESERPSGGLRRRGRARSALSGAWRRTCPGASAGPSSTCGYRHCGRCWFWVPPCHSSSRTGWRVPCSGC